MTKINLSSCKEITFGAIDDGAKFIAGKNIKLLEKLVKFLTAGGKVMSLGHKETSETSFIDSLVKTGDTFLNITQGRKLGDSWQEARGEYVAAVPEKIISVYGENVKIPANPTYRRNSYQSFSKLHKFSFWCFTLSNSAQFIEFMGSTLKAPGFVKIALPKDKASTSSNGLKTSSFVFEVKILGTVLKISIKALGKVLALIGQMVSILDIANSYSKEASKIKEAIWKDSSIALEKKQKLICREIREEKISRFLKVSELTGKIGLTLFSGGAFEIKPLNFNTKPLYIISDFVVSGIGLGSAIFENQRKDKDSTLNHWRNHVKESI